MSSSANKSPLTYILIAAATVSLLMVGWVLYQRTSYSKSVATGHTLSRVQQADSATCLPAGPHPMDQLRIQAVHAHELLQQHRYAPAVSLFREIASADPAYPGINLELSMALMDAQQPDEANEAINAQLAVSNCLAELTPNQLETYCHAEMPGMHTSACEEQVLDMRRSAHMHAALVQMRLSRDSPGQQESESPATLQSVRSAPEDGTPAASAVHAAPAMHSQRTATSYTPVPLRTDVHARPQAPQPPRPLSPSNRNPLATGDETDAALGAYSR